MTLHGGASAAPAGASYVVANVMAGLRTLVRPPRGAWNGRLVPAWRRFAPYALPLVAMVAATMTWLDAPIIRAVDMLPRGLLDALNEITDFGRGVWPLTPLGLLLLASPALDVPRLRMMPHGAIAEAATRIGYMFAAIALVGSADAIIKRIIGRVRPSELGPFAYEPFSWRSEYASLPSGHATNVFATLVAVGLIFPRARPALWVYALVIVVSRVTSVAHFPSDVLAGAAFGAFGAILVRDWFAVRRLAFYVGSDGRVHLQPGPSFARLKRALGAVFAPGAKARGR